MKRHVRGISEFKFEGKPLSDRLAPNGKPSNLSKKMYEVVRTSDFKRWFGDWENDPKNASKVLDENGEPLVVYHGTPAYGFETFENKFDMPRSTDNETNSLGFWFTNSKSTARDFTFDDPKGGVYEVFLNLRNPRTFLTEELNQMEIDRLWSLILKLEDEKRRFGYSWDMPQDKKKKYEELKQKLDDTRDQWKMARNNDSFEQFMNYRDKYADYGGSTKNRPGAWLERYITHNKEEANKKLVHEFQTGGHDGILIADTKYDAKEGTIHQFVVFDANNIKAVTNRTFNPDSSNIHENMSQETAGEGIYKVDKSKTNEMDTFDVNKRKIKTFAQFSATAKRGGENKEEKKEHEIVKDGYSGEKTGKKATETLDTRKEKKGEHGIVKDAYSGDKKGKKGLETMDDQGQ